MNVFLRYFNYFEISMNNIPSSLPFFLITYVLELFPMTCAFYLSCLKFHYYLDYGNFNQRSPLSTKLFQMSFIKGFKSFFKLSNTSKYNFEFQLAILLVLILLIIFFTFSRSSFIQANNELSRSQSGASYLKRIFLKFLDTLLCMFIDVLFCRILSFWIIFSCVYSALQNGSSSFNIIFSFLLFGFYISFEVFYFKYTFVYLKFEKTSKDYPYDQFSSSCDLLMLAIKVFISVGLNTKSFTLSEYLRIFCTIMNLFLFLSFLSSSILLLFFKEAFILFYRNSIHNRIRLIILIFNTMIGLNLVFFGSTNSLVILIFFNLIVFVFCLILSECIYKFQYNKIIKGKSILNRIVLMIESYGINDQKGLNNILQNSLIYHASHCLEDPKICEVCLESSKNIKKIENFSSMLYYINIFFKHAKRLGFISSKQKIETISTFLMINNTNNNYYLINKFYSKTIYRLIQIYPVLSMNVMCYFNQLLLKNYEDVNFVNKIINIENQTKFIKLFLEKIGEITNNPSMNPEKLILSSLSLNNTKSKIDKKLMKKIETNLDYHLIILKYIYETALNKKKSNGNFFNISYFDDLLNEHYFNDCFFLLNYNFEAKQFNILRGSQEYSSFNSNQFKSLFLFGDIALTHLKERFLETTSTTKNNVSKLSSFEFPIKDTKNTDYITAFRMNLKVFPTVDLKNFLVVGFYQSKYSHVLLTGYDSSSGEEKILSFSKSLSEEMIISPLLINSLIRSDKYILFGDVFTEKTTLEEPKTKKKSKTFYFDYKKYLPIAEERVNSFFDREIKNLTDIEKMHYYNLVQNIQTHDLLHKDISLLKSQKFYPKNYEENYICVYYFSKTNKETRKIEMNKNDFEMDSSNASETHVKLFGPFHSSIRGTNIPENYFSKSSATLNSSLSSGRTFGKDAGHNPKFQVFQKKKNQSYHQFSFFIIVILIYNIILIGLTFLFLGFEIITNNEFQSTFSFYQIFNRFFRLFFNMTISLFFNYCYSDYGKDTCSNLYNSPEGEINKELQFDSRFNIERYAFEELGQKVSVYPDLVNRVRTSAYKKGDKSLLSILESEVQYYYIDTSQNDIMLSFQNVTYLDSLSIYYTLANNIAQTEDFFRIPFQGFSFTNGADFSGVVDICKTRAKCDAYNIVLNYRRFIQKNVEMSSQLINVLEKDINFLRFIALFFTCFITGNHILLVLICLYLISIFRGLMKKHCQEIFEKLSNMVLTKAIAEKLALLKELSEFYSKNPNTLSSEYEKLKINVRNTMKEMEKDHLQMELNTNTKLKGRTDYSNKNFKSILYPTKKIIFLLFSSYFLFSIIYIIILVWSLAIYSSLIQTFNFNSCVDENVYSMMSIFQIMIFTNQTDVQMLSLYKGKEKEKGYINYKVKETFEYLFSVETAESSHQSEITPVRNILDLNCSTLFFNLPERIITIMKGIYQERYEDEKGEIVFGSLGKICSHFEFTKYKNDKLWIKEIIYRISNLNDKLIYTYEGRYEMNKSKEFLELYFIILFLFRPVRNYESTSIFLLFIRKVTHNYNIVAYTYLVLNVIFEIVLFWILRKYIINNYINTNRSLNLLSKCLKI